MKLVRQVRCPYCGARAKLQPVPPSRWRWRCEPCDAHVGCHGYSTRPLGRLADADTRAARMQAHDAFDPLWRRAMSVRGWPKNRARQAAYAWLARALNIPVSRCHIALFNADECRQVVAICTRGARRPLTPELTDHAD